MASLDLLSYVMGRQSVNLAVAPDYDATSTYAVGDYVLHGDYLYVCTTAIATPEEWTAAHWNTTTLTDIIAALNISASDDGDGNVTVSV